MKQFQIKNLGIYIYLNQQPCLNFNFLTYTHVDIAACGNQQKYHGRSNKHVRLAITARAPSLFPATRSISTRNTEQRTLTHFTHNGYICDPTLNQGEASGSISTKPGISLFKSKIFAPKKKPSRGIVLLILTNPFHS